MSASVLALCLGLLFGLSLIVAVGPQNAFVLQHGARGEHVPSVLAVCTASDVALIAVGTAGAGAALTGHPAATTVTGLAGIAFLAGYGALAARRAWLGRASGLHGDGAAPTTLRTAVLTCLALTWLNPGVYVDTVVLIGPVSHSHGAQAWWFAAGAMVASAAWFAALGYVARALGPWLKRPTAWRVLDAGVAAVMALSAVRLAAALF